MSDEVQHFASGEVETDEVDEALDVDDYDRQFHVEVVVMPWRGAARTEPENSRILLTRTVYVNGHAMIFESDSIESPELGKTYEIDQGSAWVEFTPFTLIHLRRLAKESRDALEVTADDWMEDTTEETLILPVSSLTVREAGQYGDDYLNDRCSF